MDECQCLRMSPSETESNPSKHCGEWKPNLFSNKLWSTKKCTLVIVY